VKYILNNTNSMLACSLHIYCIYRCIYTNTKNLKSEFPCMLRLNDWMLYKQLPVMKQLLHLSVTIPTLRNSNSQLYTQTEFPGTQQNFSVYTCLHKNFQIFPNLLFCEQQARVCEHGYTFSVLCGVRDNCTTCIP